MLANIKLFVVNIKSRVVIKEEVMLMCLFIALNKFNIFRISKVCAIIGLVYKKYYV